MIIYKSKFPEGGKYRNYIILKKIPFLFLCQDIDSKIKFYQTFSRFYSTVDKITLLPLAKNEKLSEKNKELAKIIVNLMGGELKRLLNLHGYNINESKFTPAYMNELANLLLDNKISNTIAKELLKKSFESGISPSIILERENLGLQENIEELEELILEIFSESNEELQKFKEGKTNIIGSLVGKVMRKANNRFDGKIVKKYILKQLNNIQNIGMG